MHTDTLPNQFQELREFLPDIVRFLEEKIPYVSALATQEMGHNLKVDARDDKITEREPCRGIVFSFFNGRFFQEWATDCLDKEFLWSKARELHSKWDESFQKKPRFTIESGDSLDEHFVSNFEIDPDEIPLSEMLVACHDLIDSVKKLDSKIVNSQIGYRDGKEHKLFVNRNRTLSSSLTICSIMLLAIGHHKGMTHVNHIGAGGVTGFEAIRFKKSQLDEMVDDLNILFSSKSLEPGTYDVVSSPEVSGILAHEAFGHGVEADMIVKGRAKAGDFLNKTVASSLVNMTDDPSYPAQNGTYFFDDEGMIAKPTQIIENGVLKRTLTDLRSATVLNLPRSANGRRESYARKVYSRMSNTFFATGDSNFEEMVGSIDNGLFLKKSSSGMEDPKGWGIQVGINLAIEIKNGRLTSNVYAPLSISGYVPDLLKSISMVGDNLGFMGAGGMCGKGHKEMVRVSAGGPHLKFKARLG